MQNREQLTQKGQDRSQKTMCHKMGKNIIFREGGGINIFFGPKYRTLSGALEPLKRNMRGSGH